MKKAIGLMLLMTTTYLLADVNVTFMVNSSTVEGVVDSTSGVDLRGTVTEWGPGTNMTSDGGDYWSITIQLTENTSYEYKYGAQIKDPVDGIVTDYWENDIPGADYQGGNRTLTTGAADMVLAMDYLGGGPDNNTPPYTSTDSVDVLFRINMKYNADFDPDSDILSMVGHFPSVTGESNMWSPGTYKLTREGSTSDYWSYHMRFAQGYIDTVENVQFDSFGAGLHMFRFALGTDWTNTENLNGAYVTGNENRALVLNNDYQDTTTQWVWWNDKGPEPFSPEGTLNTLTIETDVTNAIQDGGFETGDTLLVFWGYGGTQSAVTTDTLAKVGLTNVYKFEKSSVGFDLTRGMYYQYYRVKNGTNFREVYYSFDFTGDDVTLAERRFHALAGATDGGTLTLSDKVDSNIDPRRMPRFRNTDKIGVDTLTVFWTVDLRPAYYQVLAGDSLVDIQGTTHVTDADSVFAWGVWINGPASGGWQTWGGTLAADTTRKMYDDGTHGDAAAGDSVFARTIGYGSDAIIGQEFKFGIKGGDNESGFGLNHIENIDVDNPMVYSFWGSINPAFYDAWDYDLNEPALAIKEIEAQMPHQFALKDNYPNPFNPTTTIEFAIPMGTEVTLTIFNILGQKLATIHNSYSKPGVYKATWNGTDTHGNIMPSGVYLYELDAGPYFHKVKKMLMVK